MHRAQIEVGWESLTTGLSLTKLKKQNKNKKPIGVWPKKKKVGQAVDQFKLNLTYTCQNNSDY